VNRLFEPETGRLRLRQWRPTDQAPFAAMNADPRVMEFFPSLLDAAASDAMALGLAATIAARGWGLWAVEVKSSGAFAGFVGLNVPAHALPFGPCVEVAWRLSPVHWGQGYATEAAREALRVGFAELGLDEIVSFTVPANLRSQAVMRRLGMRAEPERFEHPALPPCHPLREHCLYRMSRERWLAGY
jgi:RimJ/RimL family protein N-acetyltransferase